MVKIPLINGHLFYNHFVRLSLGYLISSFVNTVLIIILRIPHTNLCLYSLSFSKLFNACMYILHMLSYYWTKSSAFKFWFGFFFYALWCSKWIWYGKFEKKTKSVESLNISELWTKSFDSSDEFKVSIKTYRIFPTWLFCRSYKAKNLHTKSKILTSLHIQLTGDIYIICSSRSQE